MLKVRTRFNPCPHLKPFIAIFVELYADQGPNLGRNWQTPTFRSQPLQRINNYEYLLFGATSWHKPFIGTDFVSWSSSISHLCMAVTHRQLITGALQTSTPSLP